MKVKDKAVGKMVDVARRDCLERKCYWPRPNPGSFMQGRGYRSYGDKRDKEWVCGTRQAHGCPSIPTERMPARRPVCECGGEYVKDKDDDVDGVVLRCVKCGGRYWNANDRWSDEELALVPKEE